MIPNNVISVIQVLKLTDKLYLELLLGNVVICVTELEEPVYLIRAPIIRPEKKN